MAETQGLGLAGRSQNLHLATFGSGVIPSAISLLLAVGLSACNQSAELISGSDYMMQVFVPDGQRYYWDDRASLELETPPASRQAKLIHLQCILYQPPKENDLDSSALVHCVELRAKYINEGQTDVASTCLLTFENVWESSFFTSQRMAELDLEMHENQLFDVERTRIEHIGDRFCSSTTTAALVGFSNDSATTNSPSLWNISSLAGKSVRLHFLKSGEIVAVQPTGSSLSMKETEWLHHTILPRLALLSDAEATSETAKLSPSAIPQLFPYDLKITQHSFAPDVRRRISGPKLQAIAWQEPSKASGNLSIDRKLPAEDSAGSQPSTNNCALSLSIEVEQQ